MIPVWSSIITNGYQVSMSQRSVNWLGTLNNPDTTTVESYLKAWKDSGANYVNG